MHTPNHKVEWMARILLLWLGSIILFRTPYNASNMEIFPDSVEYAVGAQHLASMDGYHMQVGGRNLPPRYPPWFSMALAPAYWLFGSEIGNAIWVVFAFSMFGLLSAFEIGRKTHHEIERKQPSWWMQAWQAVKLFLCCARCSGGVVV